MRVFAKIILLLFTLAVFLLNINITNAVDINFWNIIPTLDWSGNWWNQVNNRLWEIKTSNDFNVWNYTWEKWVYNFILNVARDLKNLFFVVATVFFLIITFKLLLSTNSEEEFWNFKKGVIWITLWLMVMQVSYFIVKTMFDKNVWQALWENILQNIIYPLISIIETWAAFFFLAVAIYAFFKMVTANWAEDKASVWKKTFAYAIVWFIVIKFARRIVESVYWKINCWTSDTWLFIFQSNNCIEKANLSNFSKIIIDIINWANSFVLIITLIMIIYAWFQVLISGWKEDKLKNAKKSIIYIFIWLFILVTNYLILTFFFLPESII